jgi:hypothetical protein
VDFALFAVKKDIMDCPECGAPETLCQTRFDEFLALEFTDSGYGAVHHLTVTAYMLQHSSKLTREGWLHNEVIAEFLVVNKPPAFIRRQTGICDSGNAPSRSTRDGKPVNKPLGRRRYSMSA